MKMSKLVAALMALVMIVLFPFRAMTDGKALSVEATDKPAAVTAAEPGVALDAEDADVPSPDEAADVPDAPAEGSEAGDNAGEEASAFEAAQTGDEPAQTADGKKETKVPGSKEAGKEPEKAEETDADEAEQPGEDADPVEEQTEVSEPEVRTKSVEAAPEAFTAAVKIALLNENEIREGDKISLMAVVTGANRSYTVTWETRSRGAKEDDPWKRVCVGDVYLFTATEETEALCYRAAVLAEDGTSVYSDTWTFRMKREEAATAEAAPETVPESRESVPAETAPAAPADGSAEAADAEDDAAAVSTEAATEDRPAGKPEETAPSGTTPGKEPVTVRVETVAPAEETVEAVDDTVSEEAEVLQTIVLEGESNESFEDVNVREEPDGMSAIFTSLPEGAEVTVVSVEGDWALVIVDGVEGYIFAADLAAWLETTDGEGSVETAPEMKVTIFTSRRTVMRDGETVVLTSRLEGFEGCENITYQWFCDKGDGYAPVEDGTEATYTYVADAVTLTWSWKLAVSFD